MEIGRPVETVANSLTSEQQKNRSRPQSEALNPKLTDGTDVVRAAIDTFVHAAFDVDVNYDRNSLRILDTEDSDGSGTI
jgi:hypothetical protein